jgi:hypothetical protein
MAELELCSGGLWGRWSLWPDPEPPRVREHTEAEAPREGRPEGRGATGGARVTRPRRGSPGTAGPR